MNRPFRLQNTSEVIAADCKTWPESYRAAWVAAFAPDPTGIELPRLNRQTQYDAASVFTRYLVFARTHGLPTWPTLASAGAFAAHLRRRNLKLNTVATHLWRLEQVMVVIEPQADLDWLRRRRRAIQTLADRQPKAKTVLVAQADGAKLLQAAFEDMEAVMRLYPPNPKQPLVLPWKSVERYRNALIVAVGMMMPERRRALADITLDMVKTDRIIFPASLIKTKRSSTRFVPIEIMTYLENWIENYRKCRPMTLNSDHLFIGRSGRGVGGHGIYRVVRAYSAAKIGVALSPHRLRDLAACVMIEDRPELETGASVLLGHESRRSTRTYTSAAKMVSANKAMADATDRLRTHLDHRRRSSARKC